MTWLTTNPPAGAPIAELLLAHGAGAPMDSPFLAALAYALADEAIRVHRFEFDYMAVRRSGGPKRPPPKIEVLTEAYRAQLGQVQSPLPIFIGGKSMGGRVATLLATDAPVRICGALAFGYPFRPPGKPDATPRTEHFARLTRPTLIVQGTRDPFGDLKTVAAMRLPPLVTLHWLDNGDHDFGVKRGQAADAHPAITRAAKAARAFISATMGTQHAHRH